MMSTLVRNFMNQQNSASGQPDKRGPWRRAGVRAGAQRGAAPQKRAAAARNGRRVLIAGNCQIGGITATLQRLFPSDAFTALPCMPFKQDQDQLVQAASSADIVLGNATVRDALTRAGCMPMQFVGIPNLYFGAFHPDVVTAASSNGDVRFPYASAICIWGYNRNVDPADLAKVYTTSTFQGLGYLSRWQSSVEHLRASFVEVGLEFEPFYLGVKREGVFMHTPNHPRSSMLVLAGKRLALRMGADPSVMKRDIAIHDSLARVASWPVYPEIARSLALPGSYSWFMERGLVVEGVQAFVEHSYRRYAQASVAPGHLQLANGGLPAGYDAVLAPALGAR